MSSHSSYFDKVSLDQSLDESESESSGDGWSSVDNDEEKEEPKK